MLSTPGSSRKIIALVAFGLGIILAILVFTIPALREAVKDIEQSGYPGAFVTGILYGTNLTSATATAIFFQIPDHFNPWIIAIIGAAGAVLYDLTVFSIFRRSAHSHWFETLKEKIPTRRVRWPKWVNLMVGLVIIASPLPDEIGAGWFGAGDIRPVRFALLSFLANAGGIFVLQLMGSSA